VIGKSAKWICTYGKKVGSKCRVRSGQLVGTFAPLPFPDRFALEFCSCILIWGHCACRGMVLGVVGTVMVSNSGYCS